MMRAKIQKRASLRSRMTFRYSLSPRLAFSDETRGRNMGWRNVSQMQQNSFKNAHTGACSEQKKLNFLYFHRIEHKKFSGSTQFHIELLVR